jgi:hypothetical protein
MPCDNGHGRAGLTLSYQDGAGRAVGNLAHTRSERDSTAVVVVEMRRTVETSFIEKNSRPVLLTLSDLPFSISWAQLLWNRLFLLI